MAAPHVVSRQTTSTHRRRNSCAPGSGGPPAAHAHSPASRRQPPAGEKNGEGEKAGRKERSSRDPRPPSRVQEKLPNNLSGCKKPRQPPSKKPRRRQLPLRPRFRGPPGGRRTPLRSGEARTPEVGCRPPRPRVAPHGAGRAQHQRRGPPPPERVAAPWRPADPWPRRPRRGPLGL